MVSTDMCHYRYFTYKKNLDAYGQSVLNTEPTGTIKIAINVISQSIQDNVKYKDSQYIGLTHAEVNDTYVIEYGNERLKVLYVNPKGRLKQVFLKAI